MTSTTHNDGHETKVSRLFFLDRTRQDEARRSSSRLVEEVPRHLDTLNNV